MAVERGHLIAGKYRLITPIARGGMGAVWRARHLDLDVDVALKLIARELHSVPGALGRFRREARAAALLRSPHVVRIHDYGVDGELPYIVMELLEGEDLASLMKREGRLTVERASIIVSQIGKALQLAHQADIVHRDLKPANVFLSHSDGEELVKVLDFGIAKELVSEPGGAETTSSALLGSPLFMSPEQARSEKVDHRSDLWSLGVVAYEMVVGEHPFRGAGLGEILIKICTEDFPAPSSRGLEAAGIDAFFEIALHRSRARRFQTAREFSERFAKVARLELGSEPNDGTSIAGRDGATLGLAATASGATVTSPTPSQMTRKVVFGIATFVAAAAAVTWVATRHPAGETRAEAVSAAESSGSGETIHPSTAPVADATQVEAAPSASAPGPAADDNAPPSASAGKPAAPRAAMPRPNAPSIPPAAPAASTVAPPAASKKTDPMFGVPVTH